MNLKRKLKPEVDEKVDKLFDIIVDTVYQYDDDDDEWYYSILNHIRRMRYKKWRKYNNISP